MKISLKGSVKPSNDPFKGTRTPIKVTPITTPEALAAVRCFSVGTFWNEEKAQKMVKVLAIKPGKNEGDPSKFLFMISGYHIYDYGSKWQPSVVVVWTNNDLGRSREIVVSEEGAKLLPSYLKKLIEQFQSDVPFPREISIQEENDRRKKEETKILLKLAREKERRREIIKLSTEKYSNNKDVKILSIVDDFVDRQEAESNRTNGAWVNAAIWIDFTGTDLCITKQHFMYNGVKEFEDYFAYVIYDATNFRIGPTCLNDPQASLIPKTFCQSALLDKFIPDASVSKYYRDFYSGKYVIEDSDRCEKTGDYSQPEYWENWDEVIANAKFVDSNGLDWRLSTEVEVCEKLEATEGSLCAVHYK